MKKVESQKENTRILFFGDDKSDMESSIISLHSGKTTEGWHTVRSGSESTIYTNGNFYVKIFPPTSSLSLARRFRAAILGDTSTNTLKADRKMAIHGFNVAKTLAHGYVDNSPFIVTEAVQGTTLHSIAGTLQGPARRDISISLAKEVARMHGKGIRHGDLNPYNVLVSKDTKEKWNFTFIDNEKNRFHSFGKRFRIVNLSQLNSWGRDGRISRWERARFLRSYLAYSDMTKDMAVLARAVKKHSDKRLERKRKKISN